MALFADLLERMRHLRDPLACQQVVELVTDYLDGAMSEKDRTRFERHLSGCPDCVAYVEQTRHAAAVLGALAPETPDPATRAALLEAFRDFRDDPA